MDLQGEEEAHMFMIFFSLKKKTTMEKGPLRWKWELSVKALHADQQRRDVEKYQ